MPTSLCALPLLNFIVLPPLPIPSLPIPSFSFSFTLNLFCPLDLAE